MTWTPSPSTQQRLQTVILLGVVMLAMAAVRLQSVAGYLASDGLLFAGPDAAYQFRHLYTTVQHWPRTLTTDPWTGFPHGAAPGQFGTFHDVLLATVVRVVYGADATRLETYRVAVVAPAITGALTAVPVCVSARRLTGRTGGMAAAMVLALLPGVFLQRTVAGDIDHTALNGLLLASAMTAAIVAADQPLARSRRRRAAGSVGAGVLLAVYVLSWPPGIVFVPVVAVGLLAAAAWHADARQPLAGVTVVLLSTAALGLAPAAAAAAGVPAFRFPLAVTWLSVGVAAGGALVGLGALALMRLPSGQYRWWAAGIAGSVGTASAVVTVSVEHVQKITGYAVTHSGTTIAEAKPLWAVEAPLALVGAWYGPVTVAAGLGLLAAGWQAARTPGRRGATVVAAAWLGGTALLAVLQLRFHAYLAPVVAVAAACLVGWLAQRPYYPGIESVRQLDNRQIFLGVALVATFLTPLLAGPAGAGPPVIEAGQQTGSYPGVAWAETLDWMRTETPPEGGACGAENTGEIPYRPTGETASDVDYPAGYYGVLSWWDYGHAITVRGERIPVTNPMQQHARLAAGVLLAPNATAAERRLAELEDPDAPVRYVAVDAWMINASQGYGAITSITSTSETYVTTSDRRASRTSRGNQTFMVELYTSNATAVNGWTLAYVSSEKGRGTVKVFERNPACRG